MSIYEVGGSLTIKAIVVSYEDDSPLIEASIFLCDQTGSSGGKTSVFVPVDQIALYQPATLAQRLAGLTVEQIEAALARKDSGLAEAFEAAGTQIAKSRRDSGDFKRRPKGTPTGDAGATSPPQHEKTKDERDAESTRSSWAAFIQAVDAADSSAP